MNVAKLKELINNRKKDLIMFTTTANMKVYMDRIGKDNITLDEINEVLTFVDPTNKYEYFIDCADVNQVVLRQSDEEYKEDYDGTILPR